MAVRAVLFDLDDTLVAQDHADDEALRAAVALLPAEHAEVATALIEAVRRQARVQWYEAPSGPYCRAMGISPLEGMWARFDTPQPPIAALAAWAPTYRITTWRKALEECDAHIHDPLLPSRMLSVFQQTRRRLHVLFPDTLACLTALHAQYRLALITNGAPDLQRTKIGGSGLGERFEVIVVSGELGIGKPDPRIFKAALERLQLTPPEAVMVGNSLAHDIEGARAAGVGSVWINRTGDQPQSTSAPDAVITNLGELPVLLAAWPG
jgi:putative hydrolase of the HAD superfamily